MFRQTTALHENLQPLHSFEWAGVRAQWGGWHREFGQKKKKALLGSTCARKLSQPARCCPGRFPDDFINTGYLALNTTQDKMFAVC